MVLNFQFLQKFIATLLVLLALYMGMTIDVTLGKSFSMIGVAILLYSLAVKEKVS